MDVIAGQAEAGVPAIPAEFLLGARYLRDLAEAFRAHDDVPGAFNRTGSVAAADLADRSFDDAWGRATFEVAHEYAPRTNVVYDHLHAMAAVIEAPNTVLAVSSLCRTILETLATVCWLYEPGLERRERVRRRFNVRLSTLGEQMNLLAGMAAINPGDAQPRSAREHVAQRIFDIKSSAPRHDFNYMFQKRVRVRGLQRARYIETPTPSDQQLIAAMFTSFTPTGSHLGKMMHRLTSANAHGQNHGALLFVIESQSSATHAGVADVQMGLGLPFFSVLFSSALTASWVASVRLCEYFGWSDEPWQSVLRPAAATWTEWQAAPAGPVTG